MAPDDESGSGSPLAELFDRRHSTTSLRQQQDHRAGVGRKGWSRAAPLTARQRTIQSPNAPASRRPHGRRLRSRRQHGTEYIARDGLTPKVGCRTLNPGTDLHEELHRHGGTAEQHRRQRPRGTPPHQRRRRQRALRRFRIARTRATPRFKISDRARAALAAQRLGLPAAFSGTSQDRLRSAPCLQPRRRQSPH
jgi:hypothetical protein